MSKLEPATIPLRLVLRLAYRSLFRNLRRTLITLSSIAFGLALAILIKAISYGVYRQAIHDAARARTGHLTIEAPAYRAKPTPAHAMASARSVAELARALPGMVDVRPRIEVRAMVATANGAASVVVVGESSLVAGVRPSLAKHLKEGAWFDKGDERGAVIGVTLARQLGALLGSKLVLTTTEASGDLHDELLYVRGLFRSGSSATDATVIQVPLEVTQRVLGLSSDRATQVAVELSSYLDVPSAQASLTRLLGGEDVKIYPWPELLPELAGWVAIDTRVNTIQRGILFLVIALTILNTLLMSVLERRREFAVLLALGTPRRLLSSQIAAEALILAALGAAAGALLGLGLSLWLEINGLDLSSTFKDGLSFSGAFIDPVIHAKVSATQIAELTFAVFVTTILAGCYPVFRSTRLNIANSLRAR